MEQLEVEGLASDEEEEEEVVFPTGLKFKAIVITLAFATVVVGLDISIVATAIPSITNHFKTVADIGWYVSALRLTSCSFQFLFGKLYSLYSIKSVFLSALLIFEAGSLLSTVAPTSSALVAGRAITGLGTAGILSGCFTVLIQTVPLRKRSIYGGLLGAVETIAAVTGPLLGGLLTQHLSWRACFGINVPLGAIAFATMWFSFKEPHINENLSLPIQQKLRQVDILGAFLFVPAVTCVLLALQWGGTHFHWNDSRIIILLVLSIVLLVVFAWWQHRRGDAAMIPPRILIQRSILAGAWFAGLGNATLAVVESYVVIYLQGVEGVSPAKSGTMILPMIVGLLAGCLVAGFGTSLIGYYIRKLQVALPSTSTDTCIRSFYALHKHCCASSSWTPNHVAGQY